MKLTALLVSILSLSSLTYGSADFPRPIYVCQGGNQDVSIRVEKHGVVYIENSECGVRMTLNQSGPRVSLFRGVESTDSDLDLCGGSAVIGSGILQLQRTITLKLNGGESSGYYRCQLSAPQY